jgi:hypothetical protein
MATCETCGKKDAEGVRYPNVVFNHELEEFQCGECEREFEDGLEMYEINKRERLAQEQEY